MRIPQKKSDSVSELGDSGVETLRASVCKRKAGVEFALQLLADG